MVPFKTVPSPLCVCPTWSWVSPTVSWLLFSQILFFIHVSNTRTLWFEKNESSFVKTPGHLDDTCQNPSLWLLMTLLLLSGSCFLYHSADSTGPRGGTGSILLGSLLKMCHQAMASATWVLLIAVIYCTVPSIPCSSKNFLLSLSFFNTSVVAIQMIFSVSWPLSSLAELQGFLIIF